ncbi:hypothetical protein DFH08DRAFT_858896 [Mycena albidolilacea]|uniref:Transmembrane protein n=1 Tax=Mycena albidolilacea TaxID=1033008 RepID=A0AAD7EX16_9AGAR|nr:hypothetical protein DFH08DRAFT_858896 [Mycena albidolilacea]
MLLRRRLRLLRALSGCLPQRFVGSLLRRLGITFFVSYWGTAFPNALCSSLSSSGKFLRAPQSELGSFFVVGFHFIFAAALWHILKLMTMLSSVRFPAMEFQKRTSTLYCPYLSKLDEKTLSAFEEYALEEHADAQIDDKLPWRLKQG